MAKQIQLTQGKVTLVSDHRLDYLSQWKWHAHFNGCKWYAERKEGKKVIYMHREITNAPDGMDVDHLDRDGLNNTDENLRVCTRSQNLLNRGMYSNNKSGFTGVSWFKRDQKYRAQIQRDSKNIHIGYYLTAEEASRAYKEAEKQYSGEQTGGRYE